MTRTNPLPIALILLVATVVTLMVMMQSPSTIAVKLPMGNPFTDHAVREHGAEVVARSEECGKNPVESWYNPEEGKYIDLCKDSAGVFAVFVYKIVDNLKRRVTAFEKEGAQSFSDLKDYAKGSGFTRKPLLP